MRPYQPGRVAAVILTVLCTLCMSMARDARAQAGAGKRASAAAGPRKGRTQPQAPDERARALLEEGRRHADEGHWDEALQVYRQALAIDPRYGDVYIEMGDAYMSSGKYKEGFAAYEQAISVAPWNPDAHYSLGAAYNDMANYGSAFKPFVQAIRLDPGFAEAHYGIGYAYLKLENFRDALVYLRQAARLKPDYAEAHLALGQTQLGLRNVKAAEGELKILADLDPTLARMLEKDMREAAAIVPEAARPATPARDATQPRPKPSAPDGTLDTPYEGASPQPAVKPKRAQDAAVTPQRPASLPAAPQTQNAAFELSFWESIKSSADPEEFAAYIRKYPDGQFVELARIRMRALEVKRGVAKDAERTHGTGVAPAATEDGTKQQAADATAQPTPEQARTPVTQPTPAPATQQSSPPVTVAATPPLAQPATEPPPRPAAEQPSKPLTEQPAQAAAAQPLKEEKGPPVEEKKEPPVEVKKGVAGEPDEAEAVATVEGAASLLRKLFPSRFTYLTRAAGGTGAAPAAAEVSINYEPISFDGCQLSWRDSNDTLSVSLSDLDAGAVTVSRRVKPSTAFSVEVWDVTIATEGGRGAISEAKGDGSGTVNVYNGLDLQYDSRQKADGMAKALRRAIKLCTGAR